MNNSIIEKIFEEVKDNQEKWNELNEGQKKVIRFWNFSRGEDRNITNNIIVDDIVWDKEQEDFIKALDEYEVDRLIFASTWSSAIELLMYLLDNGWTTAGTIVYRKEKIIGKDEYREIKGIKLIRK